MKHFATMIPHLLIVFQLVATTLLVLINKTDFLKVFNIHIIQSATFVEWNVSISIASLATLSQDFVSFRTVLATLFPKSDWRQILFCEQRQGLLLPLLRHAGRQEDVALCSSGSLVVVTVDGYLMLSLWNFLWIGTFQSVSEPLLLPVSGSLD